MCNVGFADVNDVELAVIYVSRRGICSKPQRCPHNTAMSCEEWCAELRLLRAAALQDLQLKAELDGTTPAITQRMAARAVRAPLCRSFSCLS